MIYCKPMADAAKENKSLVKTLTQNWPDIVAVFICSIVFLLWLNLLFEKFTHFGYYDWDLAIYANAMWALTHGSFSGSLWGTNFLTNHGEYISLLIIPIYWLFPSAFTLVTLKLLSLTAGGFVFYLIAKEKIGWLLSLILMSLYFAFPANFFMLIFEFHFESLAIVFLFLVYYYLCVRIDYKKFFLCCVLASLCKENIPLVIFMFGFMNLFQKQNRHQKFALSAMAIGAAIFILGMFLITPLLRQAEGLTTTANPYIGLYWTGHEKLSWISNLTANASRLFSLLFISSNIAYAKDLLLPLILMPLLGFRTLLVGLPLILQALLSNTYSMHTIYYHYAATLTPILFLATFEAIVWLRNAFNKSMTFFLLGLLIIGATVNTFNNSQELIHRISQWDDRNDLARWELSKQIPSNASVISTFEFLSHLANHDKVYPLRNVWNNMNIFKYHLPFVVPQTQYGLIDWDCPWLFAEVISAADKEDRQKKLTRLKNFYFDNHWQAKTAIGDITLLEKKENNATQQKSLVEVQKTPFASAIISEQRTVSISGKFQLLTSEIHQDSFASFNKPLTAITFYWKAEKNISDFYKIKIGLVNKDKLLQLWDHPIGYVVYSTALWEQGDYIKETYWLDTASLPAGKYSFVIAIKNLTQNRWEDLEYQNKKLSELSIATMTVK